MEPGPILGVFLSAIDVAGLSGYDLIVVLAAHQRMVSYYQAQVYSDMASVSDLMEELDSDYELAYQAAAAEIRAALRLTRRTADTELDLALGLRKRLPKVWQALAGGDICLRRARVIFEGTSHLPEGTARQVADQIITRASWLTSGQLAGLLRRLCVQADPGEAALRYGEAVAERRIICQPSPAGTANLLALDLPPDRAAAVLARIGVLARSLKTRNEGRSMDQLRADVFLDLLEGKTNRRSSSRGVVDIHVDLQTLAGLSEDPGELAGFGPVIADIARQVTERQDNAEWRFTVSDPDSGLPVHNGITRRRPRAGLRRQVEANNPTCVFPGCRMPARGCDLDHRIPYAEGGPTTVSHLAPLCRHDHMVRHLAGWRHRPLPGGDHQWTSRLGHQYTTSGRPP
jgi:hypothetical protein